VLAALASNGGISFVLVASSSFGGLLSDDVGDATEQLSDDSEESTDEAGDTIDDKETNCKVPTENRWFLATRNENVGAGLDCLSSSSSSSSMVSAVGVVVGDTVRRFAALLRLEDLLETLLQAFF
jgi:hypothetical protein